MPESYQCKMCPNYPFCFYFRGEEVMLTNPCPYEVANGVSSPRQRKYGKVEKPTAPLVLIGKR